MPTFNFLGKDKVIAHKPPFHFLDKKYSVGNNENMIIHGDNLIALKSLLPKFEGRIKCIYIDPPYNTGNENWIYNDNVNDPRLQKWIGEIVGREGEDLTRHDKWLCMMYPRLRLLQRLLADDGAIFISIDDNEQANLKLICDEIFGASNFLAQVIWERAYAPVNLKKHFSPSHDYIVCYAKNISNLVCNGLPRTSAQNKDYKNPDNDPRGLWKAGNPSVGPAVAENIYEVTAPSGRKMLPPKGRSWIYSQKRFAEMLADNRIWFGADGNNVWAPKIFLSEVKQSVTPMTIWKYEDIGHSQDATKALKKIFDGRAVFEYPKPVDLIKRCLELYSDKASIVLDSFAGSGTTAHAVINLNKADGGSRRFILIELNDYAETITAERVRRVGGEFNFYELGESLFDGDFVNPKIPIGQLREYIYFMETRKSLPPAMDEKFLLGVENGTAYYYCHEQTMLNLEFLSKIKARADYFVIYADACNLSDEQLAERNITFKQIPYDVPKY